MCSNPHGLCIQNTNHYQTRKHSSCTTPMRSSFCIMHHDSPRLAESFYCILLLFGCTIYTRKGQSFREHSRIRFRILSENAICRAIRHCRRLVFFLGCASLKITLRAILVCFVRFVFNSPHIKRNDMWVCFGSKTKNANLAIAQPVWPASNKTPKYKTRRSQWMYIPCYRYVFLCVDI